MATVHFSNGKLLICSVSKILLLRINLDEIIVEQIVDIIDSSSALSPVQTVDEELFKEAGLESKIICSAISRCGSFLAIATSLKAVLIYEVDSLTFRRIFRVPKTPTSLTFDNKSTYVIVGDRAGHICRYALDAPATKERRIDITGEDCYYEGESLSGAISMILDIHVSSDGKYLIAADRDEKIRIYRYPQSFVIQAFCLGHSEYVGCLAVYNQRLFSSGGDSIVHEWDIESGKSLASSAKVAKQPIRRIKIIEKNNSLLVCLIIDGSNVLHVLSEKLTEISCITSPHAIMDITIFNESIIGVTSSELVLFDLTSSTARLLTVSDELLAVLSLAKDHINNYFKNVTHQNMEDYQKRKFEKMKLMKEKKQRKRKARECITEDISISTLSSCN